MGVFYIDFDHGDDANDGLSPQRPLKSQQPHLLQPGDTVLFKRGTRFCGALQNPSGAPGLPITYGAYGEGEKPVFSGGADLSDPAAWRPVGERVWQYVLPLPWEVGNLIFDNGCGTLRWSLEELQQQGDWFDSCFGYTNQEMPVDAHHGLYLCSEDNPGKVYAHIEAATCQNRWLAHCGHDMNFLDLTFENNGLHAIAGEEGGKHMQIRNCTFRRIGGAVWSKELKIRFGNAVECWNICEDVLVEDCLFEDIYDSAVTHQGGKECRPAVDFCIRRNVFRKCGMAAYEQRDVLPLQAVFAENVCEDAGEGFSKLGEIMPRRSEIWPRPMGHHVFLWRIEHATGQEQFVIEHNVFGDAPYGAAIYSVNGAEADKATTIRGNDYRLKRKCLLNRMYGVDYQDKADWKEN